ncbi:DUF4974 domain-containing protein [Rhabdobacter roseus]|uniref:Ferric-dicitrate binding protein FerR (Iron transport regulator) n=1 Tax=Rhabdobacter roseus TaxID=1655419 RepID=A0A840TRE8_9BACT|nr:FecR family protein [Rhabdobacter roseus]MBB5285495.1 ferric-dicitrate binding protein FerR (iron transport regulator) [Rhabdobacter roseus]
MRDELYMRVLLARYLSNKSTEVEIKELFDYLSTSQGQRMLEEATDYEAQRMQEVDFPLPAETSRRILYQLLGSVEKTTPPKSVSLLPLRHRKRAWQMAAVWVGILLMVGLGYYQVSRTDQHVITTEAGQRRTVLLPDGSRVILNSSSTLTYPSRWASHKDRRVKLEGEAFFDIAHHEERPFYVHTSRLEIKVLGTAFNVKSDKKSQTHETTLVRGKVVVRDLEAPDQPETVLKPNERAIYNQEAVKIKTPVAPSDQNYYWQKAHLIFEDEPIQVIADELEKWYNVSIVIEEASKNCRFHLNVEQETLPEVLRLFENVTGAKTSISGKTVTIKGKLCE